MDNIDDLPEIDLDVEDLPVVDLNVPSGKLRPKAKRPPKPMRKLAQPVAQYPSTLPEDVTNLINEMDPRTLRLQRAQQATAAYESGQIQYPEPPQPHKFVPARPKIRDLGAEEAQFEQMLQRAESRIAREKVMAARAAETAPGYGAQLFNRLGRGYVGAMKSMLKGPTLLNPNARTDPTTKFLYQTPQEEQSQMQSLLPVNQYDKSFTMRATEAIGSSIPYLMGGAAGKAAGLPGWMMS